MVLLGDRLGVEFAIVGQGVSVEAVETAKDARLMEFAVLLRLADG